ncbi:transcription factor HES-5-like [Stegastes partitus]|uniref:Transcription factor HES-5-like n=1 Tax=Stegastes partitus TaxID=144197 RepID=A0A3B5AFZ8_9TELE|nr:PREDICTED: transcription factor HES-5-like [Stegastes partitus]
MKLLKEPEGATTDRKLIKSQVEKRRRERMNRSLDRLRTMLLQEPQQGGTQHRVEKAEILERTVLFLQNTDKESKARAGAGGGGQKHSFQEGFSACLQRAAQFLGPEGKGLWLGSALDSSFTARFARSDSDPAAAQRRPFTSLPQSKSILRLLRQKSKHKLHARAVAGSSCAHPYRLAAQQSFPRVPQQPQRQSQLEIRAERRADKQSSSQSCPASQTLWRPWP